MKFKTFTEKGLDGRIYCRWSTNLLKGQSWCRGCYFEANDLTKITITNEIYIEDVDKDKNSEWVRGEGFDDILKALKHPLWTGTRKDFLALEKNIPDFLPNWFESWYHVPKNFPRKEFIVMIPHNSNMYVDRIICCDTKETFDQIVLEISEVLERCRKNNLTFEWI
jgi:hypothetical protein